MYPVIALPPLLLGGFQEIYTVSDVPLYEVVGAAGVVGTVAATTEIVSEIELGPTLLFA